MRRLALLVFMSLPIGLYAGNAGAGPLLYDGFNYTAAASLSGQTAPNGQQWMLVTGTSGTNLADPKIGSGNLTGPAGLPAPAGNSVLTDNTQVGASRIAFTGGTAPASGAVYYSGLVRVNNNLTGFTNTTTGSFFAGLNNSTGAGTSITSAGAELLIHLDPNNSSAYNLGIGVTTANADRIFDSTQLAVGQTVFVVASYTFNAGADNDVARLWINPNVALFAANTPPAPTVTSDAAVIAGVSTENAQLASFFLRNNSVEPGQIQIDEVRVGTEPADVVPEPSAAVLGAACLLTVTSLRRRWRHARN